MATLHCFPNGEKRLENVYFFYFKYFGYLEMTSVKGAVKRVKRQVKEPQNPLFEQWLFEWKEEAAKNGSEMQYCFGKALRSLKKYPFKLCSGKECFLLENFGQKLCYMLDKKLEEYKKLHPDDPRLEEGPKTPVALNNNEKNVPKKRKSKATPDNKNNDKDQAQTNTEEGKSKKRKTDYVPAYRSGGYALILTLFETICVNNEKEHMTKAELQDSAQSLCDASLKRPEPGCQYTAWSSMTTLLKKELVTKQGNPPKFKLTEKGVDLAIKLKLSTNDVDKGVINTSEASNSNSLPETKSPKTKKSPKKKSTQNQRLSLSPSPSPQPCSSKSKSPVNYDYMRDSLSPSPSASERDLSPAPSNKSSDTIDFNYQLEDFDSDSKKNNECQEAPLYSLQQETDDMACSQKTARSASSEVEETIFLLPGTFDVILLVDTQETESKVHKSNEVTARALKSCGVNFEVRHLKVGDFAWICKDRTNGHELVLPYIVERKRMDDLGSSIKDGRFHEQKFRLKQSGIENLIYLVEKYGSDNQRLGLPLPTLQQASWNTQIVDGFTVKVSKDHQDSMKYLNFITVHLHNIFKDKTLMSCRKDDLPPCNVSDDLVSLMTFTEFNKGSQKTKKFTIRDMLVKQLIQLRGMSVEKALAITELYPTPKQLMAAMNEPNSEKKISNLTYGPLKHMIGPVLAKSLHQFYTFPVLK